MTIQNTRVLVIDDDKVDSKQLEQLLRGQQYDVTLASTAEEGLDLFAKDPADCVMVDYFLPGSSGIKVLETLRQANPFLPIIIVTGMGDEMVAVDALKHGAVDYFPKDSISSDLLSTTITRALLNAEMSRKIHDQQFYLEHYAHILAQDIREPIRTIRSYLRRIHAQEKSSLSADSQECLSHVCDILRNMESRIEKPDSEPEVSDDEETLHPVEAGFLINCAQDCLERKLKERELQVVHENLPLLLVNGPKFIRLFQSLLTLFAEQTDAHKLHIKAMETSEGWEFYFHTSDALNGQHHPVSALKERLGKLDYESALAFSIFESTLTHYQGSVWSMQPDMLEGIGFSLPSSTNGLFS